MEITNIKIENFKSIKEIKEIKDKKYESIKY